MKISRGVVFLICIACILTITLSIRSATLFQIVFCDVGQGAATLLQMGTYQALIDTGPNQKVLSCIGKHIPFFDHTIETIIISHNQKDHNGGLPAIRKKYRVKNIYGPLPKLPDTKHTMFTEVQDTISLQINEVTMIIHKASRSSKNLNDSANVVTIKTPHHTIFLSSDIGGIALKNLMPRETTVLAIPHHGSKYGLYPDSLDLVILEMAVISVGKKNTYGHPAKDVLDILDTKNIPVWRTDLQGELVVNLKRGISNNVK